MFKLTSFIYISLLLVLCFFTPKAVSLSCEETFIDGLTNSDNSGKIKFEGWSLLINNPDTVLATTLVQNNGSILTCNTANCSSQGSVVPKLSANFVNYTSNSNLTVNGTTQTITSNDLKNVTVKNSGILYMSSSFNTYYFKQLKVESNSTVYMTPGDYYIENLEFKGISSLNVLGSGTVRIFATRKAKFKEWSVINQGNVGDPSKLFVYYFAEGEDKVKVESHATISAYIYSENKVAIKSSGGRFYGAISAEGEIKIKEGATVTYISTALPNLDLNGLCGDTTPTAEYRFDETSWVSGATGEVIDSINGNNATAFSALPVPGKVCNAADLTASGTSDYIKLNEQILDNKTHFSISLWLKTAKAANQSLVSGANNSNFNELIMWFPSSQIFQPYLTEYQNGSFSITDISDDNWHHIVWTRNGTQNCLYRDKVLQNCTTHNASAIDIGALILGQEQDSFGGGFDSSQAVEGLIDELIIFDGAISSDEITDIYDNQNAGLGYDGSARTCPVLQPVLDMHFDEVNYSGTNAILDSSGNDYHGTATNVLPADGLLCNAADLSADSTTDYITMNASAMNGLSDFTAIVWGKSTSTQDSTIFSGLRDSSEQGSNEAVFYFDNNNHFWPTITASPFDTASQLGSTVTMNNDNWHQLVWTRKANTAQSCFYFDGVSQGCITHIDGDDNAALQIASLILGQEQDSFGGGFDIAQDWEGLLDELIIFNTVLSSSQINDIKTNVEAGNNWDGTARSCASEVDHYRLELSDNAGLTCEAESMTLKACADSSCSSLVSDNSIVNLSPSPITATTSWNPSESFTFSEQQALTFSNITATDITYGLDSATPTASFRCFVGGTEVASLADCKTSFSDVGFRFYNDNGVTPVIPTQLSGKPSDVGYLKQDIFLQAVKTDYNTGSCIGAFPAGGDVPIDLSYTCTVGTCTNPVTLTNNSNDFSINKDSYSSKNLRFDADSKAYFSLKYPDAGKIQINAKKDITVGGITKNISKSTNAFVVRPFGFKLEFPVTAENAVAFATSANGNVFKKAGDYFSLKGTAMQWSDGYDDDGIPDGIPDDTDYVSLNNDVSNTSVAKNFSGVGLFFDTNPRLILPSGGVLGGLTKDSGEDFSVNSVATNSYTYSEVGIIGLDVSLHGGNYLSSGETVSGKINNIGRFIPAKFKVIANSITRACSSGDFTYFSQPFLASYTLQAQNSAGTKTKNYQGDFVKESIEYWLENEAVAPNYKSGTNLASRLSAIRPVVSDWGAGELVVDLEVTFNRDTQEAPYVDTGFLITIVNSEGGILTGNQDHLNLGGLNTPAFSINTTPLKFRYGRLALLDTYGSEFDTLQVPMRTEYFDGTNFILNREDSCTEYSEELDQKSPLSPSLTFDIEGATTNKFSNGTYNGVEGLVVYPLDENQQGKFIIEYSATPLWLQFTWPHGSSVNPQGEIQFGRYRGNDHVIYWREQ